MRWLGRVLNDIYEDHGTTLVRRVVLAFLFGSIFGFACTLHRLHQNPMAMRERITMGLAFGAGTMILAATFQFSGALWSRGVIAKFFGAIIFLIGCYGVFAAIMFGAMNLLHQ